MPHHLARELLPLDAGSITQNGREPGEKETNVVGSFGGIAEGIPILARVLPFLLDMFRRGGKELHGEVTLLSFCIIVDFAVASF
jgi:hypothetical protein